MNTITRREMFADGLTVRVDEQGSGHPILILHGAGGPQSVAGFAAALAEHAHVFVPTHPGFAGEPRPEWFTGVDDIALTSLDLLERLDLHDVIVIGFSFGGWIAAELAVRATTHLGGLVLVDAAGIQVEGYEITPPAQGPARNNQRSQPGQLSPEQAAARAATMQTLAVYGKDRMYDVKLRRRLARVKVPALVVWGENDTIILSGYGRAYAESLPNARFELIPEAGHLPQIDQPERLLSVVREFLDSIAVSR
ncbi:alpha/beta hydrolase [Reticulibacter mediterranei]|uniref:Alpha/beta hydrolase n=1 Tax=Reticulibacter mediterranei TaxID=2778369 RepID=A0A8J3IKB2_9CHLR|nr:alpha/beta hydrolase [Reticulibacter mediterranei]GHO92355.1 alpha/beta hydrolase [Reticulibacter mediterranei]